MCRSCEWRLPVPIARAAHLSWSECPPPCVSPHRRLLPTAEGCHVETASSIIGTVERKRRPASLLPTKYHCSLLECFLIIQFSHPKRCTPSLDTRSRLSRSRRTQTTPPRTLPIPVARAVPRACLCFDPLSLLFPVCTALFFCCRILLCCWVGSVAFRSPSSRTNHFHHCEFDSTRLDLTRHTTSERAA